MYLSNHLTTPFAGTISRSAPSSPAKPARPSPTPTVSGSLDGHHFSPSPSPSSQPSFELHNRDRSDRLPSTFASWNTSVDSPEPPTKKSSRNHLGVISKEKQDTSRPLAPEPEFFLPPLGERDPRRTPMKLNETPASIRAIETPDDFTNLDDLKITPVNTSWCENVAARFAVRYTRDNHVRYCVVIIDHCRLPFYSVVTQSHYDVAVVRLMSVENETAGQLT